MIRVAGIFTLGNSRWVVSLFYRRCIALVGNFICYLNVAASNCKSFSGMNGEEKTGVCSKA